MMQNVYTKGWFLVALFQMHIFKNVDISEYMDPALLMM